MARGFWDKLEKPIFVLAPLADVTDPAFRRVIAKYGKPDVMWTEFVSADGLFLADEKGRNKIIRDLEYTEDERPIIAQFFTARPDMMERAARFARERGFDGIDINMGCPDRSVEKQGAGAGLIKKPELAKELVAAAKQGAESASWRMPVSVKTRLGYNHLQTEEWVAALLEAKPALLTLHARTRKEMSQPEPHWGEVAKAVSLRNSIGSETLIFGNGGLLSLADAETKVQETGADGMMIGKGIFGNPWLFNRRKLQVSIEERLLVMVEHARLFEELLPHKSFQIMKKNFKAYASGFDGAKELRVRLFEAESVDEVEEIIRDLLNRGAIDVTQTVNFSL